MTEPDALHFDDLELGQQLPPVEHEVTQAVIDHAAVAHLDFNPVHTDLDWTARAQPFGTPSTVAHGMFTISVMASVINRAWRRAGASIRTVESTLTKPVPAGQTIRAEATITELHPLGPGRNEVLVRVTATDDDAERVAVGSFRVHVPD